MQTYDLTLSDFHPEDMMQEWKRRYERCEPFASIPHHWRGWFTPSLAVALHEWVGTLPDRGAAVTAADVEVRAALRPDQPALVWLAKVMREYDEMCLVVSPKSLQIMNFA